MDPAYKQIADYERSRFPDYPAYDGFSPWMMPLNTGIDRVIMHLSFSPRSTPAIEAILELAGSHGLVVYDLQSNDAYMPDQARVGERRGERTP